MKSPALSGVTPRGHVTRLSLRRDDEHPWQKSQPSLTDSCLGLPGAAAKKPKASAWESLVQSLIYGVINSILTIPCMYGYAAIIFSHSDFTTFMPALAKLVLLSSVVHQIMFTTLSSLPFAIGQVQDAGLIFLSAMATSICNTLGEDVPLEAKVTTVLVTIGLSTAALGMTLVAIGKFKLAGLVSYLPMPVVGGYLAFIGLFCLFAGLSLCTGLVINDFSSMAQLASWHRLLLCAPGVAGGYLFLYVSQRYDNSFALPSVIVGVPILFFFVLYGFGYNLEDARAFGWVAPLAPAAGFSEMLSLFSFEHVHWSVLPSQVTTWVGMTFVVAFSSCLDVAAIEMDMGAQLDIDHELACVGWSNFLSGILGGYTGSYIFSQTIFTYRSKTNSRVVGICVIISEFALVVLPISIMSYVPRFFFAATLIFIAIDLLLEWLVHVYHKVLFQEYLVLWLSFLAINAVNLELGMIIGIGFAIVNFLIGYAQVNQVQRVYKSSTAIRNYAARSVIADKRDAIVVLELHGYLFFGTSVHIVEDVKKFVRVLKPVNPYGSLVNRPLEHLDGTPLSPSESKNRLPTRYLVLDFKRVTGMDATAARSCFMILQELCSSHKIDVIYANVLPSVSRLLINNDIVDETVLYRNCDEALEYCESHLILASRTNSFFRADASLPLLLNRFVGLPDNAALFEPLAPYFAKQLVESDHYFYQISEPSRAFYILGAGSVDLFMNKDGSVDNGESASLALLEKVHVGAMFGEVDFFVQQIRHLSARASSDCTVFCLTRDAYEAMKLEQPRLYDELRDVIIKSMALTIGNNNWLAL
ncbi:hypothetical protein SPRG_12507 [Saprolegnia parasitica CBS 223.65]|uniref:STAS domain-containing protein n=1 Tax=Saprolegnia parasitica (strain CBS 223.65) TaxID=695850 RepID=A0A067BSF2_SAPPC|nr:hypothetical protein SPRG_12507 [Saprolegnia parasitica CBS 223.65]KDO21464.1 hypothetical protein SPRG_12507 [Saprolegnia parasitica CBS 223.65]|eukprot:XP_012207808.1 hypothetical protein SPRG_12507 [Saprolegnia parasitica CBS 223.65]